MSINTTTSVDVQTLTPFKKFIMTIGELPTSYLESMTYGEMLMWFCNYLQNTVIPTVNNNAEAVEELQSLYEELKTYVNDYFENLDVQEEINNKLDAMAQNGSLSALISAYISPYIETQDIRIDNIDTKVDAVASGSPLVASSTSGMTDTTRTYVNTTDGRWYYYNGTAWVAGGTYQSVGISDNSITASKLKNNILLNQNMKYLPYKYNMNSISDVFSNHYQLFSGGYVTSSDGTRMTSFGYMSFTNNPVFKPISSNIEYFVNVYKEKDRQEGSFDFTTLELEQGGINPQGNLTTSTYQVRTDDYITVEEDTLIEPDINDYVTYIFKYESNNNFVERIDIGQSRPNYTLSTTYKYKIVFLCEPNVNNQYNITNDVTKFINEIKNSVLTEMFGQVTSGWHDFTLTYTNNSTLLYKLCMRKKNGTIFYPGEKIIDYILISDDLLSPLQNKKVSVLGDSFCAYDGIIPSDNEAYYYGGNAGVTNYNQMWWQRLINNNGASRDMINGWSGSNVSAVRGQSFCMSNTSRCENLGSPDVIIIMGGTNDFSHTPALLGTYDGTGTFPTTNTNFADAYALMLSRITSTYPSATVFCCSIPLFVRTNLNKAQPEQNTETNGEHKTIVGYSNKIKELAEMFNCQFIDLDECGFNRENYYPTYCQDNESNPTHPNAKGHEVIYKTIEKKVNSVLSNLT